jgi:hypothetical protein
LQLLGHEGLGVTELRIFDPIPLVAYVDNEDDAVCLCLEMDGKTSGIYVGVQPRPLESFDKAPNCWRPASGTEGNCARDRDIQYITTCFWDIDVVSKDRQAEYPASEEELKQSLRAAELLSREDGLVMSSIICCSGNGHYVLVPIVPIPVDCPEIALQFKAFCERMVERINNKIVSVKIDQVFNLSRVMRLIGSTNRKGKATADRPHRRAYFVTGRIFGRSMALHHMILNTEVEQPGSAAERLSTGIRCDLNKLEGCLFIQWCRRYPEKVSEPLWWGLITNLAHLEGGIQLIHEISRLDKFRYDYWNTQRVIQRVIEVGYKPVLCETLASEAMTCPGQGKFKCSRVGNCRARAPMYLATLRTVYQR